MRLCMYKLTLLIIWLALSSPSLLLAGIDYELNESKKCSNIFAYFEHKLQLPKDTLHAIALQESGKKHSKHAIKIVWPWTINVEGKGYYFRTKREAIKFTKAQLHAGKESIDVGCMQINLKHHPDAFNSLEQAFSPRRNIAYGAMFLRQKYEQLGSWDKAIGHYHSAHTQRAKNYQKSVSKINNSMYSYKDELKACSFSPKYRKRQDRETVQPNRDKLRSKKLQSHDPIKVRVAVGRRKEDELFRKKY